MGLGEPQPHLSLLLSQTWESQEEVAGLPLYVSDVEAHPCPPHVLPDQGTNLPQGCRDPNVALESVCPHGLTGGSAPSSLTLPPPCLHLHFQEVFEAHLVGALKQEGIRGSCSETRVSQD